MEGRAGIFLLEFPLAVPQCWGVISAAVLALAAALGGMGCVPPAQARAEGGRGVLGLALGSAGVKRAPRGAGIISAQG